jgi:broad specificity phosphatase PhoE
VPRIYFVRHGENRANVERRMAWRVIDYPLTELGARQAAAAAEWFRGKPVEAVYSSPLRRARETADHLARVAGAEVVEEEALRELAVGELDGLGDAESWAVHDGIVARWRRGEWEARFPGGESYREAHDRLAELVQALIERHPRGDVVAVGHGGLFSTVLPRLCPVPGHDGTSALRLGNTAITVLRHEGGGLICDSWGGVEHLSAEMVPSYPTL